MAVNSVKDHGNYQKYKEHPLVVLLMNLYRKQAEKTVPAVWISFIKKSTPESDMVLMSSQLARWGVHGSLDPTLRGEALLDFIMEARVLRFLIEADNHAENTARAWPIALEQIFTHHKIIPDAMQRGTFDQADVQMRCDLVYTETGTLKYSVKRRIPAVSIHIPGQWILENCGPAFSDAEIDVNYREGQANMFQLKGEGKIRTRGFALLEKIKCLLETGTPSDLFNTDTLASPLHRTFPKALNGAQWDEEPQFVMELSEPTPDPLKFGTDVIRKSVTFADCKGRRGLTRITKMMFPAFAREVRLKLDRKGVSRPSLRTEFEGHVMGENENGAQTTEFFVGKLRGIYDKLEAVHSYNELRKDFED